MSRNTPIKKVILAVTGASGSIYARLLAKALIQVEQLEEIALVLSPNAEAVICYEDRFEWVDHKRLTRYENENLFTPPASGSAGYDAMVVLPCSMGMVGRLAGGISNDLISRAADVMLKERRPLILVPREAPLSTIHLRNLTTLSECGAIICPASPSFYAHPQGVEMLCQSITERIIMLLGIEKPHYQWKGQDTLVPK